MKKERLALLIEFESSNFHGLRRALKGMLRWYGIKLLKIRRPKEEQ